MSNEPFEREKVCYEQNFEQFRSLNEQMNRVPTIAVTLTGGLWFGAAVTQNMDLMIRFALLVFAGLANVALGLSCLRIRDVMQSYAEKIRAFNETSFASGRPARPTLGRFGDYSMIGIYAVLMVFAALLSWVAPSPSTGPSRRSLPGGERPCLQHSSPWCRSPCFLAGVTQHEVSESVRDHLPA
jgi:hypothetical protein